MKMNMLCMCLLLVSGCGSGAPGGGSGGGGNPGGSSSPGIELPEPIADNEPPVDENENDGFIIACPRKSTGFPEILKRVGNIISVVTKTTDGVMYTYVNPGAHVSQDGRNCHFEVRGDGLVTEIE